MKFKVDLDYEAWIRDVEVEADSEEDAKKKLAEMTIEELLEYGYVKQSSIDDIDMERIEAAYEIKVTSLEWEVAAEDVDYMFLDRETEPTDEEVEEAIKSVRDGLPTPDKIENMTFVVEDEDEIPDLISSELEYRTSFLAKSVEYEIVKIS